jgi:hypothetical protein
VQRGPSEEGLDNFKVLLGQLPADLADAIAYRNAERIYRLPASTITLRR